MGSKSWSVIIGLGLACIVVLGVLTKVAIDSSPDLQAIIRFKTAFAKDFEDRGVSEVSVRKQGEGGSSARLLLTIPPDAPGWRKGSAAPTSSSGSANSVQLVRPGSRGVLPARLGGQSPRPAPDRLSVAIELRLRVRRGLSLHDFLHRRSEDPDQRPRIVDDVSAAAPRRAQRRAHWVHPPEPRVDRRARMPERRPPTPSSS
jgi:hypothetical protein